MGLDSLRRATAWVASAALMAWTMLAVAAPVSLAAPATSCQVKVGGTTYAALQAAVDAAPAGGKLTVKGTCAADVTIDKDVSIAGAGAAVLDGTLRFGTGGPDVDASVLIKGLRIDGSISITGHRENVPPLPTDPHLTVTLQNVDVVGHIGVSEGGAVILSGHTSVSGPGTGIRGFLQTQIILNDHSSVDHNAGCGITGTETLPVVLNDHSSIDHNGACGISLEAYGVILNDHSSIHDNAGAGVYSGDEGHYATCNDHSSILDNLYGIQALAADADSSINHGCVAGVNVYDNVLQDIYAYMP